MCQNVQGAVNNYCKQTRTWTKLHIKETGSDLHNHLHSDCFRGEWKSLPHRGDKKLDPEAWSDEKGVVGAINDLKRIMTLWLKT